jgi:acyl-CoA synthetase (AMP-forming)/AMP-acid ligase II
VSFPSEARAATLESGFAWSHPSEIPFVRHDPRAPAVVDRDRELSAAEFAAEVRRVAGSLAALGVRRGDVVATMLPNRLELVATLFAAWRLGAALTPVNPALTADEASYQVADSGARVAVVDDQRRERLASAGAHLVGLDELGALGSEGAAAEPADEDTALLIYTSGTTGRPKGVVLDHANVRAMVGMLSRHFRMTPEDRALVVMPLFHVNGLVSSILTPQAVGGSSIVLERFSKSTFWEEVERWRPTYFSMVPAMYLMLNALPAGLRAYTSSLRFCICGAAPVPPEALAEFRDRYGTPIIEGYGLSETTVACNINPLDGPQKPGSVGPPLEGCEIRIVDDDGRALGAGEPGEVLVRGPNVMRGYLNRPDETAEALRGGWLHTGDIGYIDEYGYLFLVDRKKDMIIRGGENVYPTEVEHALSAHPAVQEAAVVGRAHPVMGEEPVAFVALGEGRRAEPQELIAHTAERLAAYKVPLEIWIIDALPRSAVGKLDKPALRRRL